MKNKDNYDDRLKYDSTGTHNRLLNTPSNDLTSYIYIIYIYIYIYIHIYIYMLKNNDNCDRLKYDPTETHSRLVNDTIE